MLSEISYGIKIWTDLSSVLPQCMRLTDRQTDRQTDCTCKCDDRNIPVEHGKIAESVAAGSGRGEGWHPPRVAQCRGMHLEGQKYGILKFGRFWRIGDITLFQHRYVQKVWAAAFFVATDQPKFHCIMQLHPQHSVLFTVNTNAIGVTIRIINTKEEIKLQRVRCSVART